MIIKLDGKYTHQCLNYRYIPQWKRNTAFYKENSGPFCLPYKSSTQWHKAGQGTIFKSYVHPIPCVHIYIGSRECQSYFTFQILLQYYHDALHNVHLPLWHDTKLLTSCQNLDIMLIYWYHFLWISQTVSGPDTCGLRLVQKTNRIQMKSSIFKFFSEGAWLGYSLRRLLIIKCYSCLRISHLFASGLALCILHWHGF